MPAKKTPTKKTVEKKPKKNDYKAEQIQVLEGLDAVRKRPGMYIGSTGPRGLHHLIWEVVDNSLDEAMAGHAKQITVRIQPDSHIAVTDDGRGIPVDIHPKHKVSALELVMTKLHAGGKFGDGGYKVSGGLHGVGVSVVNALSKYTRAEVHRDGKIWMQEYIGGKPKAKIKAIGKTKTTGTTITFRPMEEIFETIEYDWGTIVTHIRQQAYLTRGVQLNIIDERNPDKLQTYVFYFEGGIASYVRHINEHKENKHDNVFYCDKQHESVQVEISLQYTDEYKETMHAFTNNIYNPDGGSHVSGFRTALTRTINQYARAKNLLKEKDPNLSGDDVREGLTAIISVKLEEPQFEGQTKAKLGNPEAKPAVETVFGEALGTWLEENPRDAEAIIGKCLISARARAAAKTARETVLRKSALDGFTLPGKLADCSSKKAEKCELFIVEGDSAGGCFSGDTQVALTDGRKLSFLELIKEHNQGKQNYCYTIMPDGNVGIEKITHPRMTKQTASVIEITLDNEETITCTPDHKFMLRDGSYKQAQNLTADDSLKPFKTKLSKLGKKITIEGYEMIYNTAGNFYRFTHMLTDDYNLRNNIYTKTHGSHRHHKDFNKLNNNPNNLIRLTKEEHLQLHRKHAEKTLHRPDVIKKCNAIKQTPAYREKISRTMKQIAPLLSKRAKKQWQNPEYKQFMVDAYKTFYESNVDYRNKNQARLNKAQKEYWSKTENRDKQSQQTTDFFNTHPERKKQLQKQANEQWSNKTLREWRSQKTQTQWTDEFRAKRKEAYNRTYKEHSLRLMYDVYKKFGSIEKYDQIRTSIRSNKNYLKLENVLTRFFDNNRELLLDAVKNYNHRIVSIKKLEKQIPVYDIEVPNTHNFALASGVFVHNSAKSGRNREFQAILPLRGKILNTERARLDKILQNNELKALTIALGTNIGESFDLEKLRYDRIIIATDADVDGSHIRTLLLTFFFRYFPELVHTGHIYSALPPLFKVTAGKEMHYAYSDKEKDEIIADMHKRHKAKKGEKIETVEVEKEIAAPAGDVDMGESMKIGSTKINIQRYKGLGEMNPSQLWETTMNPENRKILQVTIEDAEKADEIFDILMGNEVAPRRKFIQAHAAEVQNLDV